MTDAKRDDAEVEQGCQTEPLYVVQWRSTDWQWKVWSVPLTASHAAQLEAGLKELYDVEVRSVSVGEAAETPATVEQLQQQLAAANDRAEQAEAARWEMLSILAEQWKQETGHLSNTTMAAKHPCARAIVSIGWQAVPFILQQVERRDGDWCVILAQITGESPIPEEHAGYFDKMCEAWVRWGKERGVISQPPGKSTADELRRLRELLAEVYCQAGNGAAPSRRHALTPALRDSIRDVLYPKQGE